MHYADTIVVLQERERKSAVAGAHQCGRDQSADHGGCNYHSVYNVAFDNAGGGEGCHHGLYLEV